MCGCQWHKLDPWIFPHPLHRFHKTRTPSLPQLHHQWCVLKSWLELPWLHRCIGASCTSRARIWHPHNATLFSFHVPERWPRGSSLSCGVMTNSHWPHWTHWRGGELVYTAPSCCSCFTAPFFPFLLTSLWSSCTSSCTTDIFHVAYDMCFHIIYLGSRRIKGIALFTATQMLYISNNIFIYSYSHHLTTHRQFLYALELECILLWIQCAAILKQTPWYKLLWTCIFPLLHSHCPAGRLTAISIWRDGLFNFDVAKEQKRTYYPLWCEW